MALEPNKEQIDFIESKNSNVLVSASAGSGKTYSMIQKLIHILCEDRLPINSLLVLTFTEAAANEIKQRLYNEISSKLNNSNDIEKEFLQKQLDNINNAEIGTLHSVCKKLIIKYFYELEQSPDFAVLSDKESKYLLDNAISNVFESHILSNDEMFFELYDCYNAKRNDTSLKSMITQLLDYINNKIDYSAWKDKFLQDSYNENLNENKVCKYLHDYYKYKIKEYSRVINDLIEQAKTNSFERYFDFLYNRMQFVDRISNSKNFLEFVNILNNTEILKKPIALKSATALELDFDEHIGIFNKSLNDLNKKAKSDLVCENEEDIRNNFKDTKSNVVKLFEIAEEIKQSYEELKKKKNFLDFNDLEDKMLELLKVAEVKQTLKNTYSYIFFDEYQDINEKQERILSEIVSGDNYYMIGDVKQSIYAFRQSSPKIFIDKFNKFKNDNIENRLINFNKNYRSDRNILEFNNFIFDKLITEKTIGIDYKNNSRFLSNNDFTQCNVDMKLIDIIKESNEEEIELDKERNEALVVADTIANILTKTKQDGTRFTYKDIAIILRKRGSFLKTLCEVLKNLQIPVNATINYDFFGTNEIELLVAILKVISNYKDDISISIVLKNLFKVSEQELIDIRLSSENKYYYQCVNEYSKDNETKKKINSMFNFLKESKVQLCKLTIREFLENVIEKFDLINYLKSMPDGEDLESNIYEFLSIVDNDLYKYNLDKFLEYLDFVSKDSSLQNIGVGGNSVQICTIHYSKGLEYPAVIFAGLGKKFSLNKDTNDMIINSNFGIGLKSIDNNNRTLKETLIRNACKIQNKQEELNEEIRLLYVAMTRPKEYLCLIGQYDFDKYYDNKSKGIYSSNNYLDMILKCIKSTNDIDFANKVENFKLNDGESSEVNVQIINSTQIIDNGSESELNIVLDSSNKQLQETLCNVYSNKPNLQTFTIKNTVTNILREETDYENLNYMPYELNEKDKIVSKDFLKIGTAYHTIMQELKFTETLEEVQGLVGSLIAKNYISQEIVKDINIQEIYNAKENLKDLILNAKQVYTEKQFVMQESYNKLVKNSDNNTKVIIQGIIDLVVVSDNGTYLIDYKTNRTNNEEKLISDYALQLEIYKIAFEKATNIKIDKKFLYSFYMQKLIEVI